MTGPGSGCPKCRGVQSEHCDICHGRPGSSLKRGERCAFWTGTRLWLGRVESAKGHITVVWSDGVKGKFQRRHANRLIPIGALR